MRMLRMKALYFLYTAMMCMSVLGYSIRESNAAASDGTIIISTTTSFTTMNPYGDSSAPSNTLWCQVYGCLGVYDYKEKKYKGLLVDRWELINETTWRFYLKRNLVRQDGGPSVTSADVIRSFERINSDPASAQQFYVSPIAKIVAVDDYTFDMVTKAPFAPLLNTAFDRFIITSDELYKKYGTQADSKAPFGWGPYKLDKYVIDQEVSVSQNPRWPDFDPKAPKAAVYRIMREPDQRVTALLNDEVQVAVLVPPQLIPRLKDRPEAKIIEAPALEIMFLALNPGQKPWSSPLVRQAASLAIDRKLIIDRLLGGLADPLDGLVALHLTPRIGPQQFQRDSGAPNLRIST